MGSDVTEPSLDFKARISIHGQTRASPDDSQSRAKNIFGQIWPDLARFTPSSHVLATVRASIPAGPATRIRNRVIFAELRDCGGLKNIGKEWQNSRG
jgi:hypothetical protein